MARSRLETAASDGLSLAVNFSPKKHNPFPLSGLHSSRGIALSCSGFANLERRWLVDHPRGVVKSQRWTLTARRLQCLPASNYIWVHHGN